MCLCSVSVQFLGDIFLSVTPLHVGSLTGDFEEPECAPVEAEPLLPKVALHTGLLEVPWAVWE